MASHFYFCWLYRMELFLILRIGFHASWLFLFLNTKYTHSKNCKNFIFHDAKKYKTFYVINTVKCFSIGNWFTQKDLHSESNLKIKYFLFEFTLNIQWSLFKMMICFIKSLRSEELGHHFFENFRVFHFFSIYITHISLSVISCLMKHYETFMIKVIHLEKSHCLSIFSRFFFHSSE